MSPVSLHEVLVTIQSCGVGARVRSQLEGLARNQLASEDALHAYLRGSPRAQEIITVVTGRGDLTPPTISAALYCINTILSHTCQVCEDRIRTLADQCCSGPVYSVISSHLSSDDASIRNRAVQLCSTVVLRSGGTHFLRRLNWSQRVWRHSTPMTTRFIVNALITCPRIVLTIEGCCNVVKLTLMNPAALSAKQLGVVLTAIQENLRISAPLLSSAVLGHLMRLHQSAASMPDKLAMLNAFIATILATTSPVPLMIRAALALDVFTSIPQRTIVLDWIKKSTHSARDQYLKQLHCSLDPRMSFRWVANVTYIEQLLRALPFGGMTDSLPSPLTKSTLSAGLQRPSRLTIMFTQRVVLALAERKTPEALALLPDGQVLIRSASGPDDDLYLRCVRGYIGCGLMKPDTPWTLFSQRIHSGNALADYLRAEMLCNAPTPGSPPLDQLMLAVCNTTDPRIFSLLVTMMARHGRTLTPAAIAVQAPKRQRLSAHDKLLARRFHGSRTLERSELISSLLGHSDDQRRDAFFALTLTTTPELARRWTVQPLLNADDAFSQLMVAMVYRRFPSLLRERAPDGMPLFAQLLIGAALPPRTRLEVAQNEHRLSLLNQLIPDIEQAINLPSIADFKVVRSLDQSLICHITSLAQSNPVYRPLLNRIHSSPLGQQRFALARQTLDGGCWMPMETVEPVVADDHVTVTFEDVTSRADWVDDANCLEYMADHWGSHEEITVAHIDALLRSYSATTSPLDLLRLTCIEVADTRVSFPLHGCRFGAAAAEHSVAHCITSESNSSSDASWFWDHVRPLIFPAVRANIDARFMLPAALAAMDRDCRSQAGNPSRFISTKLIECGMVGFALARGLPSEDGNVRACAYALLARVHQSTGVLNSQAALTLDVIRNSIMPVMDESEVVMELPRLPNLTCSLWAAMFDCIVSRKGVQHPMFRHICRLISRRAWLQTRQIPEEFQLQDPFESARELQWSLQFLCEGIRSNDDAKMAAKALLWPRVFAHHDQFVDDKNAQMRLQRQAQYWRVIESAIQIDRSRSEMIELHGLLPFLQIQIREEGAIECLDLLVSKTSSCSSAVRAQFGVVLMALSQLDRLNYPRVLHVAAGLARLAQPSEASPFLSAPKLLRWIQAAGNVTGTISSPRIPSGGCGAQDDPIDHSSLAALCDCIAAPACTTSFLNLLTHLLQLDPSMLLAVTQLLSRHVSVIDMTGTIAHVALYARIQFLTDSSSSTPAQDQAHIALNLLDPIISK